MLYFDDALQISEFEVSIACQQILHALSSLVGATPRPTGVALAQTTFDDLGRVSIHVS